MLKHTSILAVLAMCTLVTGCSLFLDLLVDAADPRCQPPADDGKNFSLSDWTVIAVTGGASGTAVIIHRFGQETIAEYGFPDQPDLRIVAGSGTQDGLMAFVNPRGVVSLALSESQEITHELSVGALAVGWSNAGDRLAVLTRQETSSGLSHELMILTRDLSVVDTLSLQLDETFYFAADWPFPFDGVAISRPIISWSADDQRVAIRTPVITFQNFRLATGVIVNLADGSSVTVPYGRIYFVGSDAAVGTSSEEGFTRTAFVYRLQVKDDGVEALCRIPGNYVVIGSNAVREVFGALEIFPIGMSSVKSTLVFLSAHGTQLGSSDVGAVHPPGARETLGVFSAVWDVTMLAE